MRYTVCPKCLNRGTLCLEWLEPHVTKTHSCYNRGCELCVEINLQQVTKADCIGIQMDKIIIEFTMLDLNDACSWHYVLQNFEEGMEFFTRISDRMLDVSELEHRQLGGMGQVIRLTLLATHSQDQMKVVRAQKLHDDFTQYNINYSICVFLSPPLIEEEVLHDLARYVLPGTIIMIEKNSVLERYDFDTNLYVTYT